MQQATLSHRPIDFKKERNFSQKLNATFEFLSQNFKPIGKNLLLIAGPFALLTGICYGIYQTYTFGAALSASTGAIGAGQGAENLVSLGAGVIGMFFFSLIALTLVVAIVMRHIQQYVREGHCHIDSGQLWKSLGSDFFRVLGTSIAIMVALTVGLGIFIAPLFALVQGNPNPVFIFFLGMLLFFSMLIIVPAFTLLYPIRSMEKKNIFLAFGRMFRLLSGKWFSTAGLVIVAGIIQSIMSVIFAVPMYIMLFLQVMHTTEAEGSAESPGLVYNILLSLSSGVSMLGSFALYSILFIAITFQYYNLVERKEAAGLLERLENFGAQQTDPHDEDEHY
jgi:hypothetical protein